MNKGEFMKKILLIIPAYNEEDCILDTFSSIEKYNIDHGTNYDVIVINDGSKDNTAKICEKNNIQHITLVHNLGIGGAVQTGYKYAYERGYDIAVQFDGDGQHDVHYVEKIVKPIINKKADFVIGSRFVEKNSSEFKSSATRRIGIKIISLATRFVTGKKICDTTSGFRAVNKEIIYDFSLSYPTEYPESISSVELLKKKYILKEVAVKMNERVGGVSSIRTWKTIYFMINVILSILICGFRRYKRVK